MSGRKGSWADAVRGESSKQGGPGAGGGNQANPTQAGSGIGRVGLPIRQGGSQGNTAAAGGGAGRTEPARTEGRSQNVPTQAGGGGGDGTTVMEGGESGNPVKGKKTELPAPEEAGRVAIIHPLPGRPGNGTGGSAVKLEANYFELNVPKELVLYRYQVKIVPEGATGGKLKRIFQLLIEEHLAECRSDMATDYKATIISKSRLQKAGQPLRVQYRKEGEDVPRPNAPTYQIQFRNDKVLSVSQLVGYAGATKTSSVDKDDIVQALNIILGHHPKSDASIVSVGANKHFAKDEPLREEQSLGSGLEALRGYFVSVRPAQSGVLVNVQVQYAACFEGIPLGWLMSYYLEANEWNYVRLAKYLKGLQGRRNIPEDKTIAGVATKDDGEGEQKPKVEEFAAASDNVRFFLRRPSDAQTEQSGNSSKPSDHMEVNPDQETVGPSGKKSGSAPPEGEWITVSKYFERYYDLKNLNQDWPVVNIGNKLHPVYVPAEQNFGISIKPQLITVPGRRMDGPLVHYGNGKSLTTNFGSWNMLRVQFNSPKSLPTWTYLWISFKGVRDSWRDFQQLESTTLARFRSELRNTGITEPVEMPQRHRITLSGDGSDTDAGIDALFNKIANPQHGDPPSLVLVILPRVDTKLYNRVKLQGDIRKGIHTICVVGSKFAKIGKDDNVQYFANVALKFNLKLGGINQSLEKPPEKPKSGKKPPQPERHKLGLISEGRTMVIGVDVTHPSPTSASTTPSVAGMVASVDKHLAQWPADIRINPARQEMVSALKDMMKGRLEHWATKNSKAYPDNILVYRDGVSEGQYNMVLNDELPQLREACTELYPKVQRDKNLPNITIVVVGKRHHTRFYPMNRQQADQNRNPKSGTVVDCGVTDPRGWDFYMQAHKAIQGTARPAHYVVLIDEIFRKQRLEPPFQNPADYLEDLTHNMCYLYGRATKAVSICPPAYYADLACERARKYLSGVFDPTPSTTPDGSVTGGGQGPQYNRNDIIIHDNLKDSMFYI
ncbi:hypothetical protein H2199_007101 [Coniosporium tulheliwenetii]|uniref:Uncharacterized protein n=1 Tax=Coniosporium tulheliwenetii TaxID=3383036 RepID=A0ACC2YSQ8_9PEZI|nr:hypothetical protein H2199_007101 [Cladosporium sp. JES 115]